MDRMNPDNTTHARTRVKQQKIVIEKFHNSARRANLLFLKGG